MCYTFSFYRLDNWSAYKWALKTEKYNISLHFVVLKLKFYHFADDSETCYVKKQACTLHLVSLSVYYTVTATVTHFC